MSGRKEGRCDRIRSRQTLLPREERVNDGEVECREVHPVLEPSLIVLNIWKVLVSLLPLQIIPEEPRSILHPTPLS